MPDTVTQENKCLPGVYFTREIPKIREALPRMDIAAFVGFASDGPHDKPIVVEDVAQFRSLFGEDLALAWDTERGEWQYSQLGSSVESFFQNGGRRCWIVRVADEDSLDHFSAEPFLDEDFSTLSAYSLLSELEHKQDIQDKDLRGIYSLLPIDEVTLVAVPDIAHRSWSRNPPTISGLLEAPELDAIPEVDQHEDYTLSWSEVLEGPDVIRYVVQVSDHPDFPAPSSHRVESADTLPSENPGSSPPRLIGPENSLTLGLHFDCSQSQYFRVRAEAYGEVSPWSNTRGKILPHRDFIQCEKPVPEDLELRLSIRTDSPPQEESPSAGENQLEWEAWDSNKSEGFVADDYQLQQAEDSGFISPEIYDPETQSVLRKEAIVYYRVRAIRNHVAGPWSNTVRVVPSLLSQHSLENVAEYDNSSLLEVQRALIRFCAVRGDMLALLSLPRHYRVQEVSDHLCLLREGSHEGELSYAALYHPWLSSNPAPQNDNNRGSETIRFSPPDGAVSGTMASLTLSRGAWLAPANQPLQGTLSLDPDFNLDQWQQLDTQQVNVIRRDPRGFMVFNAETLFPEQELSLINVRRLLILLRRLALREGNRYLFEPNDFDFRNAVQHQFEQLLLDLFIRGAIAGRTAEEAFRVVTDRSVNTSASLDRGQFIIELHVAPSQPLRFIHVRLVQKGPGVLDLLEL